MLDSKRLKRLSRAELLELLLAQTMETERLQDELDKANAKLADREIKIDAAGNLAEAVLNVNGVMEAAQAAAQQYIDNARDVLEQTKHKCELILKLAKESANLPENSTDELNNGNESEITNEE